MKKSLCLSVLALCSALSVAGLELSSPWPPFVQRDEGEIVQDSSALHAEFMHSGILCGNKELHWNVSSPLQVLIGSELYSLFTCRAETSFVGWQVLAPGEITVEEEAKRVVFHGDFVLNEAGEKGRFTRDVQLLDDGRVKITCSWNCPETDVDDFKAMWFRIFIPRIAAAGNSLLVNENVLSFPSAQEWSTSTEGRSLSEGNTQSVSFIHQNRRGYTLRFAEKQALGASVREKDVLIRTRFPQPQGSFTAFFDFGDTTAKVHGDDDCVVAGINFTECNDMTVPVFPARNLLINPSFESGTRYYMPSNLKFVDISGNLVQDARFGAQSYRLSAGAFSRALTTVTIPIRAGSPYTISLFAKNKGEAEERLHVSARSYGNVVKRTSFTLDPGDWKRYSWTFSLPAQALKLSFSSDSAEGVLIDGLQLEEGTAATEYAGNTLGMELLVDSPGGMVIDSSRPVNPRLLLRGETGRTGQAKIHVSDLFRRDLFEETYSFSIGGDGQCILPLPLDGKLPLGVILVRVDLSPDGLPGYTDFLRIDRIEYVGNAHKLSSLPATNRFTSNKIGDLPESELDFCRNIGIGMSRKYSFSSLSEADIQRLRDKGIEMVNVEMISTKRTYKDGKLERAPQIGWEPCPGLFDAAEVTPALEARIEAMACEAAKKYPFVKNWIGPNEPQLSFRVLRDNRDEDFAKILVAMFRGIKRGNPKATVCPIGGACNMSVPGGIRETDRILQACRKIAPDLNFDATVIHTYRPFPESPDTDMDTVAFLEMLRRNGYGDDHPVYWNEGAYFFPLIVPQWMGIAPWAGVGESDKYQSMLLPSYDLGWGERVSSAMLLRHWLVAAKYSDRIQCATTWMPLLVDNRHPFAWVAMQTAFLDILGDSSFRKDIRFAPGARTYVFEDQQKRPVAAVWLFSEALDRGKEKAKTMAVELAGSEPEFFDMMGNLCSVNHNETTYYPPLSSFPFYIRGKPGQTPAFCEALDKASVENLQSRRLHVSGRPFSRDELEIVLTNPLSKPFEGTISVAGEAERPLRVDGMASERLRAPFQNELSFGAIENTSVPVTIRETAGGEPERDTLSFNVFTVKHVPVGQITPDCATGDWQDIPAIPLTNIEIRGWAERAGLECRQGDNFSGSWRMAWNEEALYLLVEMRDDAFVADHTGQEDRPGAWYNNDVIQIYIDAFGDAPERLRAGYSGYDENDFSYELLPVTADSAVVYRRLAPDQQFTGGLNGLNANALEPGIRVAFRYKDGRMTYEVMMPARYLMPLRLETGTSAGFGMTVLDRDPGMDRAFQNLSNTPAGTYPFQHPEVYPVMFLTK